MRNGGICVMMSNSTLPLGFINIAPSTHPSGGRYCHKTTLFLDDELVAGEINFEEMENADGATLSIFSMTVNRLYSR